MHFKVRLCWILGLGLSATMIGWAHEVGRPSVHDTLAQFLERQRQTQSPAALRSWTPEQIESLLTPAERDVFARHHLRFEVNVPVRVTVLQPLAVTHEPFWLRSPEFRAAGLIFSTPHGVFEAWERDYPAGEVGLGVPSFRGGGRHYLVLVKPQPTGVGLWLDHLYPQQLRVAPFEPGVEPYVDRTEAWTELPLALRGQWLIRMEDRRRDDARLAGAMRTAARASTNRPDHLVLTWSGDPATTQAIQWRTSLKTRTGYAAYRPRAEANTLQPRPFRRVKAQTRVIQDPRLLQDASIHWHTVQLEGLAPGTAYQYCVGDGSTRGWSEIAEFTTAPAVTQPFSFIYLGDAQNGFERWGSLIRTAYRERPDAAFWLMAGDLVNRGNERDDWDDFFHQASGIFSRRPLVPVIGNHECQGGHPRMYVQFFALPHNGPTGVEPERAYAFEYSNALFVVLDSNLDPARQVDWLEAQLARTRATWKFVSYHHPAYSSAPNRDNVRVRDYWTPLFDKYHVDLVLQGHDHAYLRTHPLKGNQTVQDTKEGTVYLVSVSGTKMYSQADRPYTAFGMTNVSTYQVLDIQIQGGRLVYRAFDTDGDLRDQLVITK
jgi:3',5'-cyclic AMP phosphodiesterase CpdA